MDKHHRLFSCLNCHKRIRAVGDQLRRNFCSKDCELAYQVHRANMFIIHGDENYKERKNRLLRKKPRFRRMRRLKVPKFKSILRRRRRR